MRTERPTMRKCRKPLAAVYGGVFIRLVEKKSSKLYEWCVPKGGGVCYDWTIESEAVS